MDPHEMVVKNPYAQFIIPRAHLRPDLGGQQPEATPSCSEPGPPASGPCVSETLCSLEPGNAKGAQGVKGVQDAQGAKGAQDAQGAKGAQCAQDAKGMKSAQGAQNVKGAKGAIAQGQQTWQPSGNPCGCGQRTGLTYAGRPPVGRGDDIAHNCCCCRCCSCCHCPRFCRCHSCCCVVS